MKKLFPGITFIVLAQLLGAHAQTDCVPRQAEFGIVCVCNATYCDFPGPVEVPTQGQFVHYVTSEAGDRFKKTTETFVESYSGDAIRVTVDRTTTYQQMYGFGGAMTDAAGINIKTLSDAAQEQLLKSTFSPDGNQYVLVRIPMGGCDFSTHQYSYDDGVDSDDTLEHFNLTVEDFDYKIPLLRRAQELNPNRLLLYTAPWSAPKWMKTNNAFIGKGSLKTEYYQLWAQYFIKYLQAYKDHGLNFWAVSTGNEPISGNGGLINCMGWSPETQQQWLVNNLGPTIAASDFSNVLILIYDENRSYISNWLNTMLSNATARDYAAGIALHWYQDTTSSTDLLDETHEKYPNSFLLYTEACTAFTQQNAVALGAWDRGETYVHDIIENVNHWVAGWTEWNFALNPQGGPNWDNNPADAPIIVNATADEFYKNPMFYAIGHFSKFVPEGSTRIALDVSTLEGTAFVRPDGATVVVLLNTQSEEITATIVDGDRGQAVVTIPAKSIHTLVWQ